MRRQEGATASASGFPKIAADAECRLLPARGAWHQNDMTLSPAALRVMIDSDRPGQPGGTGIASYTRTLAQSLQTMGHQVIWLSGAAAPRRADPLIDAASLADQPVEARGLRLQLETLGRMASGLTNATARARRVDALGAVIGGPGREETVLLAPHLFVDAHYRHMLTGQFTEVKADTAVDVLHLCSPVPIRMQGVRTLVSILDLVPVRLPWTTTDNKREYIHRVRTAARLADMVITISETSRRDIIELLQVDPGKIAVTRLPSDLEPLAANERDSIPRVMRRYGLEAGGYALFVGAIEPKKNLRRLIEAFLETRGDAPLVIVGRKAWKWREEIGDLDMILGEAARKRLRFLGYADREDLRRLYAGARAFLFPSLYEGFGLPALDGMAAGCPTLVSRTGALQELCGEAAAYCEPMERDSIRAGIETVMDDETARVRLAAAGPVQALRFSAEAYVGELADAYRRLV